MDRFQLAQKIKSSKPVDKIQFIQDRCRGIAVLDLGCIRHSADFASSDPDWLHGKIREVASMVTGVDYLPGEVEKLRNRNFDIVVGDVTKPLAIDETFDVIVAGDLLEHLTNFDGFFDNCLRLLKPHGELIVSTPNPFYTDQFHFVAFKNSFLINPEHTCWIDPQALSQLAARFGFEICDIHYVLNSWKLHGLIRDSRNDPYDILNDRWTKQPAMAARIVNKMCSILFKLIYLPFRIITGSRSPLVRHSDYLAVLKKSASQSNT